MDEAEAKAWFAAVGGDEFLSAPSWQETDGSWTVCCDFPFPRNLQEFEPHVVRSRAGKIHREWTIRQEVKRLLQEQNQTEKRAKKINDRLCSEHERIDLNSLKGPAYLGQLDQIFSNDTCCLCRLVSHMLASHIKNQLQRPGAWTKCHIIRFPVHYNTENGFIPPKTGVIQDLSTQITLLLGGEDYEFRNSGDSDRLHLSLNVIHDNGLPRDHFRLRRIPDRIDAGTLQSWLNLCDIKHGSCCKSTSIPSSQSQWRKLRVIDVQFREVVAASESCKYLALSYVWGGDQYQTFRSTRANSIDASGSLTTLRLHPECAIPTTIKDAMGLTLQLGFRYLWVDAICIVQDEPRHLEAQISLMASIYSAATLTIVAAGEGNANSPLPGVREGTRKQLQQVETINGLLWANVLPRAEQAVDKSTWNSRAWTLQERVLSRRCLIFTPFQVFFQCAQESWCEDTHAETVYKQAPGVMNRHSLVYQPNSDSYAITHAFEWFAWVVNSYSKRKLTKPEDTLVAFQGIAHCLEQSHGIQLVSGIPISRLASALLWEQVEPLTLETAVLQASELDSPSPTQGAMLPSWSWAAWNGEVRYCLDDLVGAERRNKVVWYNHDTRNREALLMPEEHKDYHGEVQSFADNFSIVKGAVLRFWTSLATFNLIWADEASVEGKIILSTLRHMPGLRYALITDECGKHAGEILLDLSSPFFDAERCESTVHEFILLCQAREVDRNFWRDGYGGRSAEVQIFNNRLGPGRTPKEILPKEVQPWSYLRVMLIVRRGDYIYRAGVGTVHKDAWDRQRPVWGFFRLL